MGLEKCFSGLPISIPSRYPLELGARFHYRRGKRAEVVQLFGDDGLDHVQVQAGIFMHSDVAEADHALHASCEVGRKNSRRLQESECIAAVLRDAELAPADDIHGQIDGRFAGALKIEDNRVLFGLIRGQVLLLPGMLLLNTLKTSFDAGGFVENDVVSHRPTRVS